MNNAEMIKGIERTIEGLELIKKCLSENTEVAETSKEEKKPTAKAKKSIMPEPVEEEEEVASA